MTTPEEDILFNINQNIKYIAINRKSNPKGNIIEQIIYKADWECVLTLADTLEKYLEGKNK